MYVYVFFSISTRPYRKNREQSWPKPFALLTPLNADSMHYIDPVNDRAANTDVPCRQMSFGEFSLPSECNDRAGALAQAQVVRIDNGKQNRSVCAAVTLPCMESSEEN